MKFFRAWPNDHRTLLDRLAFLLRLPIIWAKIDSCSPSQIPNHKKTALDTGNQWKSSVDIEVIMKLYKKLYDI